MKLNFTKMHGAGNDFIMVDGQQNLISNYSETAQFVCDRHFGIGADGLIVVLPAEDDKNDFRMRIFNVDGSEAEMCGNGIRCFTHFVHNKKLTDKQKLRVETPAGIITPQLLELNNKQSLIKVDMGEPGFNPEEIPIQTDSDSKEYEIIVEEQKFKINPVSMGNPHAIIFTDEVDRVPLALWGPEIENNPLFPARTNVEFIEIINSAEIKMRVWERGAGITLACGTGACASAVVGINKKLLNNLVTVHLPGGKLQIEWQGENVFMTGPSQVVFTGEIELTNIKYQ